MQKGMLPLARRKIEATYDIENWIEISEQNLAPIVVSNKSIMGNSQGMFHI